MMPADQPNIVFFFTDDQRFDTLSGLGHPQLQTPNLDRLMARGTAFTEAHIPGGLVGAICMPSRAMLHTGRTLFHLEDSGRGIPDDHTLLGQALQGAGYHCFGSGKWHNGKAAFNRSFSAGSEIFFGGMHDHWNVPCFDYDPTGAYAGRIRAVKNWQLDNSVSVYPGDRVTAGKHSSELIADAGLRYLRDKATDAPHFMYLSFLAPHDPRTMPDEYRAMYDPADIELPANFLQEHPFDFGVSQIRDELLANYPRTEAEVCRHIAEYYAMITHVDAQIGRVIAEVEARGEIDNTVFIMAGDNGLAVGQHGLMGKQNGYEHSVRVPLMLAGPGISEGVQRDEFVYLLDIFPTLCDCLGVPVPDSVEGQSFRGLLASGEDSGQGRADVYYAYDSFLRSIKDRQYKLLEYRAVGGRKTQLFDYRKDPSERYNLAPLPEHRDRVAAMRQRLRNFAEDWDDEGTDKGREFWAALG